jgi:hypothetical protein
MPHECFGALDRNATPAPGAGQEWRFLRVLRGPEFPGACRDSQVNCVIDAWTKSAPGKHEISFSNDEDESELKKNS